MPRTVRIVCFPKDDVAFCLAATKVLGSLSRDGRTDGELATATEEMLRGIYPVCVVRSRDPLASYWPEQSVWYVYRDGSALTGLGPTEEELGAGTGRTIDEIEATGGRQD